MTSRVSLRMVAIFTASWSTATSMDLASSIALYWSRASDHLSLRARVATVDHVLMPCSTHSARMEIFLGEVTYSCFNAG